ncbi:MAG: cache domain-containing protein [Pseudomonadota bacterium]
MITRLSAIALTLAMLVMAPVHALDKGRPDEAVAMTKLAVATIKEVGKEKAFAAFANVADKRFHDRDLYIYVYDMKGVALAHGVNPKMVGKNLLDMRDGDGKYIVKGFIEAASSPAGHGWVEYKWPNPLTKSIDAKAGYVETIDDIIVGAGVYK